MRHPKLALSAAVLAFGLSASIAVAQRFFNAPAPTDARTQAQAPLQDPMTSSRSAKSALRNGLDYLNYKEYTRALRYLRTAESRLGELDPTEQKALKVGIEQAQRGLRETGVSDGIAARPRNRPVGAITVAPRQLSNESTDGIQLTSTTQVEQVPAVPATINGPVLDSQPAVTNPPADMPVAAPIQAQAVSAEKALASPIEVVIAPASTEPPDALPKPPAPLDPKATEVPGELLVPAPPLVASPDVIPPSTPVETQPPTLTQQPEAATNLPKPSEVPSSENVAKAPPALLSLEPLNDTPQAAPAEPKGPTSAPAPEVHTPEPTKTTAPADLPPLATASEPLPPANTQPITKAENPSPVQASAPAVPESAAPRDPVVPAATAQPAPTPADLPPISGSGSIPAPETQTPPGNAEPQPTPNTSSLPPLPDQPVPAAKPELVPDATPTSGPNPEPAAKPAMDPPVPVASEVPVQPQAADPSLKDQTPPVQPPVAEAAAKPEEAAAKPEAPGEALPAVSAAKLLNETTSAGGAEVKLSARQLRPETEEAIAKVAQRQTEEARARAGQSTNLPTPVTIINPPIATPGDDPNSEGVGISSNASTRFELTRAPSPTEAWPIRRIPIPEEFVPFQPRVWEPSRKYWSAPAYCHMPLYFQDAALERYGHSVEQFFGPAGRCLTYPIDDPKQSKMRMQIVQPFWSIGLFALQVGTLPYKLVVDPPWEAEYNLGYYRPGDRIPTDMYYLPLHGVGQVLPPIHGRNW